MAFVSGVANNVSELLAALRSACTANGWELTGSVLHSDGAFVETSTTGGELRIRGGTGVDGSNQLINPGPAAVAVGQLRGAPSIGAWPVNYSLHVLPDPVEVFMLINFEIDRYHWLSFGRSGSIPGTGIWYAATESVLASLFSADNRGLNVVPAQPPSGEGPRSSCAPFWSSGNNNYITANSFVHHGLDSQWSGGGTAYTYAFGDSSAVAGGVANAGRVVENMLSISPNIWNSESVLLPIQVHVPRAAQKGSMVAELGHARYLRIDNYEPGDVIILGADRWRIYPWFRKNSAERNGGSSVLHSGTFGWAIRYDGP